MRMFVVAAALLLSSAWALADVRVVASIKPIHSLVAIVMEGAGTPDLLLNGQTSPHNYTLKPSDAAALTHAQIIFWVGPEIENFLAKPIAVLGGNAKSVTLIKAEGVKLLPQREEAGFAPHEHGEEDHGDETFDGHIWLDPENAKAMLQAIAKSLSEADPDNATLYQTNADKASESLTNLSAELATSLSPLKGKGFIVFHDAYHYFEDRFGLSAAGAIAIHPENPPGAKTIADIQQRIAQGNIECVFDEPQFENKVVSVIIDGASARSATLDPIGANIEPGTKLYESLLRNLATSMTGCLLKQ